MARRQQTNTSIRSGQELNTNVNAVKVPEGYGVDTGASVRADNFLKQLSVAKEGIGAILNFSNQRAQATAQSALAEEQFKQAQLQQQIDLQNQEQAKIQEKINKANWEYSQKIRKEAEDKQIADDLAKRQKELRDKNYKTIMAGVGLGGASQEEAIKAARDSGDKQLVEMVASKIMDDAHEFANSQIESLIEQSGGTATDAEIREIYDNVINQTVNQYGIEPEDLSTEIIDTLVTGKVKVRNFGTDKRTDAIVAAQKESMTISEQYRDIAIERNISITMASGEGLAGVVSEASKAGVRPEDLNKMVKDQATRILESPAYTIEEKQKLLSDIANSEDPNIFGAANDLDLVLKSAVENQNIIADQIVSNFGSMTQSEFDANPQLADEMSQQLALLPSGTQEEVLDKIKYKQVATELKDRVNTINTANIVRKAQTGQYLDENEVNVFSTQLNNARRQISYDEPDSAIEYMKTINGVANGVTFMNEKQFDVAAGANLNNPDHIASLEKVYLAARDHRIDPMVRDKMFNSGKMKEFVDAKLTANAMGVSVKDVLKSRSDVAAEAFGNVKGLLNGNQIASLKVVKSLIAQDGIGDMKADKLVADDYQDFENEAAILLATNRHLTPQEVYDILDEKYEQKEEKIVEGIRLNKYNLTEEDVEAVNYDRSGAIEFLAAVMSDGKADAMAANIEKIDNMTQDLDLRFGVAMDGTLRIMGYDANNRAINISKTGLTSEVINKAKNMLIMAKRESNIPEEVIRFKRFENKWF